MCERIHNQTQGELTLNPDGIRDREYRRTEGGNRIRRNPATETAGTTTPAEDKDKRRVAKCITIISK